MGLILVVTFVVVGWVYVGMLRDEYEQMRGRTLRHLASGGKLGDAPDWVPYHGGGASRPA